jgi:hypothetical protein
MKISKILLIFALTISAFNCGGIHRVAQSHWNSNNQGENTDLRFYFSLDNDVDEGSYLRIGFPSTLGHVPTSCNIWALTDTLEPPTTFVSTDTLSGSSPFFC